MTYPPFLILLHIMLLLRRRRPVMMQKRGVTDTSFLKRLYADFTLSNKELRRLIGPFSDGVKSPFDVRKYLENNGFTKRIFGIPRSRYR